MGRAGEAAGGLVCGRVGPVGKGVARGRILTNCLCRP